MNPFDDREISVLQILEDDSDAPNEFLFQATGGRPALRVEFPAGLTRLVITEDAAPRASATLDLDALASPGLTVTLGAREVHLQFLRARGELHRGPLLVFEGGVALPCIVPARGFMAKLLGGKPKAVVPVHVVAEGDETSRQSELVAGMNVALELIKGRVVPGRQDNAYLAPEE